MQRLKTAIKKMAAIGAGVAMLGATMTGAIAASDLSEYPAPFVTSTGAYDESTAIVVGANAAASDTLGAVDIATNLQFMAKTPVAGGGGTVSVVGGVTEDIPLGLGIAQSTTVALDWQLNDGDISSFQDTTISFQGADYDVHDEIVLSKDSPTLETSLTSSEDDYESGVFMEVKQNSIKYIYVFDDTINVSKASTNEPLEIKFLGKTLKITNIVSNDKFTAYVGSEFFMDVGDVVTIEGKKITLSNVGSGGAIVVEVDGTIESIPASTTETVNGIEITNDETFYADAKDERSASLVIGIDSQATYNSEDPYVGEDSEDPDWVWDLDSLDQTNQAPTLVSGVEDASITGPQIAIENDFVINDDSDNPPGPGECLSLPNNYASICFDSLTIPDEDYLTLTIEYTDSIDLTETKSNLCTGSGCDNTKVIQISAPGDERFILPSDSMRTENGTLNNNDKRTSKVWLWPINGSKIALFYDDSSHNPRMRQLGDLEQKDDGVELHTTSHVGSLGFMKLNYESTKDSNIWISLTNATTTWGAENVFNLVLDVNGDSTDELPNGADNLVLNFSLDAAAGNWSSLGATASEEEASELNWLNGTLYTKLGTKDEDHRTKYGIIIKDPKSNGASDQVVLEIPSDDVQANVVIKGQATSVVSDSKSYIPADITIDTKLDTEISNAAAHQLILVGGPVVNSLTAKFVGTDWTLASGEALIKLVSNGENVALVVAGTDAIDTRMAAKVIANYEDYNLETTEAVVTGTLSAPQIKVA